MAFCLAWFTVVMALLLLGPVALAQSLAGSNSYMNWSTQRVGSGPRITTFTPAPGVPGQPTTHTHSLSDLSGGTTRTPTTGNGVKFQKPVGLPVPVAVGSGTQTLTATLGRTATKQAIVKGAGVALRLTNPLGLALLAGSLYSEFYNWDGTLKTSLKDKESLPGADYPATYGYPSYVNANTGTSAASPEAACALSNSSTFGPVASGWTYQTGANAPLSSFNPTNGSWSSTLGYTRCIRGPNTSGLYASIQINGSGTAGYQCPSGGTVSGTTCTAVPATLQCPTGYSAMLLPLSDEYECAPISSGTAVWSPPTDAGIEAWVDKTVGTDPEKMDDLLDQLPGTTPIETSSTDTTGPSSLPNTTSSGPREGGGTQTSTGTTNVTYNQNKVTITQHITTNYYNEEGDLVSTTEGAPPEDEDVGTVVDSALPTVPDFYTQKFPEGFAGVWEAKKAALSGSAFAGLLTTLKPSWGDSGECPSFSFGSSVLGVDMGGNFAPPCTLWPILRLIFIVTALFVARRIIFGG